jgi:hypothetical protein
MTLGVNAKQAKIILAVVAIVGVLLLVAILLHYTIEIEYEKSGGKQKVRLRLKPSI